MAWLAVDKDGSEWIYTIKPVRGSDKWEYDFNDGDAFVLLDGFIMTFFCDLTWEDEPVEVK